MATTLATQTTTTMTSQLPTQSSSTAATTSTSGGTTPADILRRLQQALRRNALGRGGGGGGGSGGGGGRAPGAPGGAQNIPQQPAQPPQDVKMMGTLPSIFSGDREQADNFMEQLKGYIHLNHLVPGMNLYIQQVAVTGTWGRKPHLCGLPMDQGKFREPAHV